MTDRQARIISLIHREVKPALGCTEPIAVALACAKAAELLPEDAGELSLVKVGVSPNILKNGMGVGIPGTGKIGLHIAAALGALAGKSEYGLEVLKDITDEDVEKAISLVENRKISLDIAENGHVLYVWAEVRTEGHCACATVMDSHDRIVKTEVDGKVVLDCARQEAGSDDNDDYGITVREIFDFANEVAAEDIAFILEDKEYNLALAEEGLKGRYGLCVGKTLSKDSKSIFGDSFLTYAMSLTAAASDARMAGSTLPAMSNSGSGNQGITVSVPVIAYALHYGIDDETLSRALIMSNLIAIHIKHYLGKLSALCGCVVASTGAACGITWIKGGSYEQVCATIKNMIGNITGMVCDGAKVGCALKVASGVSSAIQSAMLSLDGHCISSNDGIIDDDIEKTIENLGRVGSVGMQQTDRIILDIMVCK